MEETREGWLAALASRTDLVVASVVLLVLVALAFVAATWLVRNAVARTGSLKRIRLSIVADPAAPRASPRRPTIPASTMTIDVIAPGGFPATGVITVETKATGTVRLTSRDDATDVTVPAGTLLWTGDGIEFLTLSEVRVPRADANATASAGANSAAGRADDAGVDVAVEAVVAGPEGNVGAGAITVVPWDLENSRVSAVNPSAFTGGSRTDQRCVTDADYDAAVAEVRAQLPQELESAVGRLRRTERRKVVAATARLGPIPVEPTRQALVGQRRSTFEVRGRASASVTVVDERQVAEVAAEWIRTRVPRGYVLVERSFESLIGEPTADGTRVRYAVEAWAARRVVVKPRREPVRALLGSVASVRAAAAAAVESVSSAVRRTSSALALAAAGAPRKVAQSGAPLQGAATSLRSRSPSGLGARRDAARTLASSATGIVARGTRAASTTLRAISVRTTNALGSLVHRAGTVRPRLPGVAVHLPRSRPRGIAARRAVLLVGLLLVGLLGGSVLTQAQQRTPAFSPTSTAAAGPTPPLTGNQPSVRGLISDTFDLWPVAVPPGNGWTAVQGVISVAPRPTSVDRSLHLRAADAPGAEACKPFEAVLAGALTVTADVLLDPAAGSEATVSARSLAGDEAAAVAIARRGTVSYRDGAATLDTGVALRGDTWHRVTVTLDATTRTYDLVVSRVTDRHAVVDITGLTSPSGAAGIDRLCVQLRSADPDGRLYVDNVRVVATTP